MSKPEYINPKSITPFERTHDIGRRPDRPFMILATLAELALGDLLCKIAYVTTLKDQFEHARLIVRYNNFRSYSSEIVALSPNIDHAVGIGGEIPRWLRPLMRDLRLWRPLASTAKGSRDRSEAFYDMVLVDSMMSGQALHDFGRISPLRVPDHLQEGLERELLESGLERSSPFAVVHYRDGSYGYKSKNPVRNGDPECYRQAIDHIIDNLGCQVVQIGHPEMKPFPARGGFVDLSRRNNAFMLQAFAVSHARFHLAGASGPATLGWAFEVPTAITDCCLAITSWSNVQNLYLTQELTTPDGERLRNKELFDRGLLDIPLLTKLLNSDQGYKLRRNSAEELRQAASYMHAQTKNVTQWRTPPGPVTRKPPNVITWPRRITRQPEFFDM